MSLFGLCDKWTFFSQTRYNYCLTRTWLLGTQMKYNNSSTRITLAPLSYNANGHPLSITLNFLCIIKKSLPLEKQCWNNKLQNSYVVNFIDQEVSPNNTGFYLFFFFQKIWELKCAWKFTMQTHGLLGQSRSIWATQRLLKNVFNYRSVKHLEY